MSVLKIDNNKFIGGSNPCFIIAEIGQNHQGSIEIAKQLIEAAKECGADCVKFQKSCLQEKFTHDALKKKYESPHSWGPTYGEHKRYLEFSDEQYKELQKYAQKIGIYFTASAMDMISVDFLVKIKVPFLKIGSGDSNNTPLLKYAASKQVPLVVSTGMINQKGVLSLYNTVSDHHKNFCLMHCVSSYPTPYEDCNLNVITDFRRTFPDIPIGYSGHEIGITVTLGAVALGAKVVERHFTLNKMQKGSDHICSITPVELKNMIHEIRILEKALGSPVKSIMKSEMDCIKKLQKSLVLAKTMQKGDIIQYGDLKVKVADIKGVDASLYEDIIQKTLSRTKLEDEPLFETDFY